MNQHDQIANALDSAADYLEKYGWRRGTMGRHGHKRCALGAIQSATVMQNRGDLYTPTREALREHLKDTPSAGFFGLSRDSDFLSIAYWNDSKIGLHEKDPKQTILDTLRDAAKMQRVYGDLDGDS